MRRSFRSLVWAVAAACCVSPAFAADPAANTLTPEEKAAGWKLLFDGKSTAGWRNYQKDSVGPGWKVENGELSRVEKDAGDIITKDEFGAFELTLDYKISEGGNSGLMYHVKETEKRPWQTGPEIQIQDNKAGHDPQKAGWLYQFYSSDKDSTKPAGEWNTLRIVITPEKCEHFMNGVKYFDYVKGSADWNARYEKSKFKAFPNFGKATSGHICLQDHNNLVSFRNIKIRDLGKPAAAATSQAKPTTKPAAKPEAPQAAAPKTETATTAAEAQPEAAAAAQSGVRYTTTQRRAGPLQRLRNALNR